MHLEESLQLPVLLHYRLFLLNLAGVDFLELHDLLLQGFDVHLFTLAMGPRGQHDGEKTSVTNLCACRLSSWRRVKAGLLSGLGPRFLGA